MKNNINLMTTDSDKCNMTVITTDGFKDLVYTGHDLHCGNVVFMLDGSISTYPTQTSIQIGPGRHIEDDMGIYMNHDCNPNCEIVGRMVFALKKITNGASLTFDYSNSEDFMATPFKCNCCGKMIRGKMIHS